MGQKRTRADRDDKLKERDKDRRGNRTETDTQTEVTLSGQKRTKTDRGAKRTETDKDGGNTVRTETNTDRRKCKADINGQGQTGNLRAGKNRSLQLSQQHSLAL